MLVVVAVFDLVFHAVVDDAGVDGEQREVLLAELLVDGLEVGGFDVIPLSRRPGSGLAISVAAAVWAVVGAASAFSMECSRRASWVRTESRVGGRRDRSAGARLLAAGDLVELGFELSAGCMRDLGVGCRAAAEDGDLVRGPWRLGACLRRSCGLISNCCCEIEAARS